MLGSRMVRIRPVTSVIIVAAGAGLLWLVLSYFREEAKPSAASPVSPARPYDTSKDPPQPTIVAPTEIDDRVASPTVIENEPSVEIASPPPAEERVPTPASVFEAKYPRLDQVSVNERVREVDQQFSELQQRIFNERNEAGLFDIYPYVYDDNGNLKDFTIIMPDLTFAQPFHSPDHAEWHVVFIREREYPELFTLWDERAWLRAKSLSILREGSNQ